MTPVNAASSQAAFAGADEVWLGPIHRADSIPADERLDRDWITETLSQSGVVACHTDDVDAIVQHIRDSGKEGDIVLILSNGAFGGIYAKLQQAFA